MPPTERETNIANLMILDPATGEVLEVIGSIGFSCTGLAFAPDGTLYGSTGAAEMANPKSLIRINTVTGAGTLIGSLGPEVDDAAADITFSPQGVLYGWNESVLDDLITINQTTGVASPPLGDSGLSTYGSGLAFAPNGTLYFAGEGANGPLHTINPATGLVTSSVTMSGANDLGIGSLAVNNAGVLFGVRKGTNSGPSVSTDLITINPTSGFITSVGIIRDASGPIPNMDAIAFSPIVPDIRTGFWVPAGESGQTAMSIEIQRDVLALGWGAYDDSPAGEATWIFAQADRLSGETFSGPLLSFAGGPCFTCSPTPLTSLLQVGTITITFTTNTAATISGSVSGVNFNKTISKTFGQ